MFWIYVRNNISTGIIFLFEDKANMKKHLIEEHAIIANIYKFLHLIEYLLGSGHRHKREINREKLLLWKTPDSQPCVSDES